jgi:iron(III) transport system permease protein
MRMSRALIPVLAAAIAATLYVLIPLLATFWIGFLDGLPGASQYTLGNYLEVLRDTFGHRALLNTVLLAVPTTFFTIILSLPLAWSVARTDLPFKQWIVLLMGLVLIIPGFIQGMGWSILLGPKIGMINRLVLNLIALEEPPFDIFTLKGMIFVQTLNLVPPAFFLLVPVLSAMDATLEEAAFLSGAGKFRVFARINLPLAMPAIAAAAIYVVVLAFSLFEIPAVLGFPHRIFVFSTMIYILTHTGSGIPVYGLAAAYGTILMALSALLTFLYSRVLRQSHRFVTITGKGRRGAALPLGRWRSLTLGFIGLYFLLSLGLPLITLVWVSLIPFFQIPSLQAFSTLTLKNYVNLLDLVGLDPFLNTTLLVLFVPVTVILLAMPVSWVIVRSRVPGRFIIDGLAFLPSAVPRVVLAVSILYLGLLIRPVLPIYGTIGFIAAAFLVMYLSFATRAINGAITQIHRELEEAGRVSGASAVRVIFRVTVPLLRPALFFSWLWVLLLAFREVTMALMLNSPTNIVLPVLIWNRWNEGRLPEAAAATILLTLVAVVLLLLGRRGLQRIALPGIS